jgi:nucleoside-diphosphate-sugar epimerase
MRVFLAGATGVIGRRVVPRLTEAGHSVTGLVRRDSDVSWLRDLGADAAVGDVFDRDGLPRAVGRGARPTSTPASICTGRRNTRPGARDSRRPSKIDYATVVEFDC